MLDLCLKLYGVGVAVTFGCYFALFWSDRTTSLSDRSSWLVLLVASVLWPVVLPISLQRELLPRLRRAQPEPQSSQPLETIDLDPLKSGEG